MGEAVAPSDGDGNGESRDAVASAVKSAQVLGLDVIGEVGLLGVVVITTQVFPRHCFLPPCFTMINQFLFYRIKSELVPYTQGNSMKQVRISFPGSSAMRG